MPLSVTLTGWLIVSFINTDLMLNVSCGSFWTTLVYTAFMFSATCSSGMSSLPIMTFMLGCTFADILIVCFRFSVSVFRLAFGGTTQPAFGFGILPSGPNTLPNDFAKSGMMFACAMK